MSNAQECLIIPPKYCQKKRSNRYTIHSQHASHVQNNYHRWRPVLKVLGQKHQAQACQWTGSLDRKVCNFYQRKQPRNTSHKVARKLMSNKMRGIKRYLSLSYRNSLLQRMRETLYS